MLKGMHREITGHGGKVFEELIQRLSAFEIIKQRLERDSRSAEDRRAAQNIWVADDHVVV